jgi:UDP-N-acetylglucosamine acyltransferase
MPIHKTAIIDNCAVIDPTAEIGPFVTIEGPVHVGAGTRIGPHVSLAGWTLIGADCQVYPHAAIGHAPQDLAYDGAESLCRIGDGTIVREGATVHRGTAAGSSTVVGKDCFLMVNSHVAHNCVLGDRVVLANGVLLAGHAHVGDRAFLGGGAVVHQFARIGELVMVAGLARVSADVPPFFTAGGDNRCLGVNIIGLRRAGFTPAERDEIRRAYRLLYRSGTSFAGAIDHLAGTIETEPGQRLLQFLQNPSKRGFIPAQRSQERGLAENA